MLIAQITDTHVVERGRLLWDQIDTNGMLEAAVRHVNRLDPAVDVVVATGDLVDRGQPEQYDELVHILKELDAPLYPVMGNHDDRSALLAAFDWLKPTGEFVQYIVDAYEVRLVVLDTTIPGEHRGELCADRLGWLDARLADAPGRPTVVLMHHPPFRCGIEWMDATSLSNADELADVIERHDNVVRVLCGHVHRPIQTSLAGTIASSAPSTAHQVDLALDGVRRVSFAMDPPAVQLHRWGPESGLLSHISYIDSATPFHPPWYRDS